MNLELFIAKRIYKSDKKNNKQVSSPAIKLAIIAVTMGLSVMIASICIIIGFKNEIRNKIIGFDSHLQLKSSYNYSQEKPIYISDLVTNAVKKNSDNIKEIKPFVIKPGIIKTKDDFQGILLKGISSQSSWDFFKNNIVSGKVINQNDTVNKNEVIISENIENKLHLKVGDMFITYFIQDPIKARKLTISGIYKTDFENYDKLFVITNIDLLQKLNKWDKNMVTGLELILNDFNKLDETYSKLSSIFYNFKDTKGNNINISSVKDINPIIFNWLELININVIVIIILMAIVCGFTMISALFIIIMEKTNMIGILKALGSNNLKIRKVFIYLSMYILLRGMIWGNIISLFLCAIQYKFHIIKLNPDVYYLSSVPINFNLIYIAGLNICTIIITYLMVVGPSHVISKIVPYKTMNFD